MLQEKYLAMKKIIKGFTLIELLVVILITGILSSLGVVGYRGYTEAAKETATLDNYNNIVRNMESEFAKCKLDSSSIIYNSHNCNLNNDPSDAMISNYFNNTLNLKNPYNKTQPAVGSNVCTQGSVSIKKSQKGTYNVSYASKKKNKKSSSIVSSKWSKSYTATKKSSISYTCSSTGASGNTNKGSFANYKPPHNGSGAGIIVDKNGNMVKGQGAHACGPDCFKVDQGGMKNWYTFINGQKVYPARSGGQYRFVMVEGANPNTGNIASSCSGGNCKYNFANNTYTVLNSGKTYKAGEPISQRQPVGP